MKKIPMKGFLCMPNEGCSIHCVTCIFSMQSDCELAVKIYITVIFFILLLHIVAHTGYGSP